ncbi:hypothetical protein [Sutcliffiella cohnii]|uniref:hypothetical protein n=1 Tax=Sutcliffiella cohnii TaxID=33932 RepID=UPI002E244F8D|nr:hypothetical protein [Sutcliffiella cohnii]
MVHFIIDNEREGHEWLLVLVVVASFLTFRKINKLEKYKSKLYGKFNFFSRHL